MADLGGVDPYAQEREVPGHTSGLAEVVPIDPAFTPAEYLPSRYRSRGRSATHYRRGARSEKTYSIRLNPTLCRRRSEAC
jgi:hypothetical protein